MKKQETFELNSTLIILLSIAIALVIFNQFLIFSISPIFKFRTSTSGQSTVKLSPSDTQDIINKVISTGTPDYGKELGVSFDNPVQSLNVLASLDRQIPTSSLTPEQKERYINIGTRASCEYCCSAPAVIDSSGRDLCGCSHSAAMRGLAKWFIVNHPDQYDDKQILVELGKWKTLWYPRDSVKKAIAIAEANNGELDLSLMAGKIDPSQIKDIGSGELPPLPSMVGGC